MVCGLVGVEPGGTGVLHGLCRSDYPACRVVNHHGARSGSMGRVGYHGQPTKEYQRCNTIGRLSDRAMAVRPPNPLRDFRRAAPQNTCLDKPVDTISPKIEPLPAAIREREDQFVTRKIARSLPVAHLGAGGTADGAEAKRGAARVRSRGQAIHRLFKRRRRSRSHRRRSPRVCVVGPAPQSRLLVSCWTGRARRWG